MSTALVLGGIGSGKSRFAESLAASLDEPPVYVAPGEMITGDAEWESRIRAHRRRRPIHWPTVECGAALWETLRAVEGPVLVDSLGSWLACVDGFAFDASEVESVLTARTQPTLLVSEEVGFSLVPPTAVARRFADSLGALNRLVASIAEDVFLVAAGIPVALKGGRLRPSVGAVWRTDE
ncbi:MAG: putative cobinamide kinase/cobinamide phosphate guanylyltransferase CobU [Acidimicrobiales bacterium]|nr:MAG: putative cobinamide kinase/cobinamide phosphate guanylyltransferase CobU [Acidimicrobiales bacterium]